MTGEQAVSTSWPEDDEDAWREEVGNPYHQAGATADPADARAGAVGRSAAGTGLAALRRGIDECSLLVFETGMSTTDRMDVLWLTATTPDGPLGLELPAEDQPGVRQFEEALGSALRSDDADE